MENTSLTLPFIQEGSIIVHHFQLHFWSFLSMAADLIKSGTTKHTHTHSFHVWPHCWCEPIKSNYWLIQRYELGSCVCLCHTHKHIDSNPYQQPKYEPRKWMSSSLGKAVLVCCELGRAEISYWFYFAYYTQTHTQTKWNGLSVCVCVCHECLRSEFPFDLNWKSYPVKHLLGVSVWRNLD